MTGRVKVGVAIAIGMVSVLSLGGVLWVNRPFQAELGTFSTSLADRTYAQRHNIQLAAQAIDGIIVEPDETFSFNEAVGPRTPERGYREAPAFMERDLVRSIGGGICQVSSTVYNAAADAGLPFQERHPHFRVVSSVPPGRDATVWFGTADLKFRNPFPHPILMQVTKGNQSLQVSIFGSIGCKQKVQVFTIPVTDSRQNRLFFKTVRKAEFPSRGNLLEILSVDSYEFE